MNNTSLKPCPFCGGTAKIAKDLVIYDWFADNAKPFAICVGCSNCHAMFIFAPSDQDTIDGLIKNCNQILE